jgi:hypothetical protein
MGTFPNPPDKFEKALAYMKANPQGLTGAAVADHAGLYFDHFVRNLKKKGIKLYSRPAPSGGCKGNKKLYSFSETFS